LNSVRTLLLALLFGAATLPAFAQAQYTPPSVTVTNPLDKVHYQYKWELYGGIGYAHIYGGPNLIEGAGLGGPDIQIARFFSKKWGVDANYRGYFGTSPTEPNVYNIRGPFVSEQFAVFGPEYRAFSNKHVSMTFHALGGTAYGDFQRATAPLTAQQVETQLGLYHNQWTPAGVLGVGLDLNRDEHLAFRIEPDATLTHFSNPGVSSGIQTEFALSVGVIYRFIPRHMTPAEIKNRAARKKAKEEIKKARGHRRSLLHPF
jgi:hypothetical protein